MQTEQNWERIKELFGGALELDPNQRAAYLDEACGEDVSLRDELESLLREHDSSTSLLQQPLQPIPLPELKTGSIGPYQLLSKIGEGGMGQVWLAQRSDGSLKRTVAIKLPYAGFHTREFLERFNRERDILASLAHPHIATLYDAGVTEGQPFLVLEYIEGEPITAYSERTQLDVAAQTALFRQVLEAVQYAHSHLVVHRDLKPSNILVTADGKVKLLDFGIAKLIGSEEAMETELTQAGGRILTPDYAAPEQITGKGISTATDIYALGVVLYELLTGVRPWKRDSRRMLEEAILHTDPVPPSVANRERRSTLRGDLDAIVLKALRKEPGQRYATANAFSEDLRRYLAGEPVLAQPESAWYRTRKFLSRRRWAVASAASVVIALALGLTVALWQAHVARRETRVAAAVDNFLEDIFRANSSDQQDPVKARQTTARELLDIGAKKIDGELADVPEAKLDVLATLGRMYTDLGLDDQAVEIQRKRVSLTRVQSGNTSTELANALIDLGGALHASHSVNQEEAVFFEAQRILDKRGDFSSRRRGNLLVMLAQHYRSSDLRQALDYSRQAVDVFRRYPNEPDLAEALFMEGEAFYTLNQPGQAEPLYSEAVRVSQKLDGDPNSNLPRYYAYQGLARQSLMEFAAAEDSLRRAASAAQKINGDNHVDTLETQLRLGLFLFATSRTTDGLQHLDRAKDILLRTRGETDPFYMPQVFLEYGWALGSWGHLEDGLAYITKAAENRRKNRPGTQYFGQILEKQAAFLIELGRYAEAEKLMDEASAVANQVHAPASYVAVDARARLLIDTGRADKANLALDNFHPSPAAEGTFSLDALKLALSRAELALALHDSDTATHLAAQADQQLTSSAARGYLKGLEARAALIEGRAYLLRGRPADALPFFQRALDLRQNIMAPVSPAIGDVYVDIANCYFDLGDTARAIAPAANARKIFTSHRELGIQYTRPMRALDQKLRKASSLRADVDHL